MPDPPPPPPPPPPQPRPPIPQSSAGGSSESNFDDDDHIPTPPVHIEDLKLAQEYIQQLRCAKLEESGLSDETLQRLCDPPRNNSTFDDDPSLREDVH